MATLPLSVASYWTSHPKAESKALPTFGQILRLDREFIKSGIQKLKSTRLPVLSKSVSDIFWMRSFENPHSGPEHVSWPSPSYPGLSGLDLMLADVKAIKEYTSYFYYASRIWAKPLPEVYDAERVGDYFRARPHVVVFRVLEVLAAFGSAAIKIRALEVVNRYRIGADKKNGENSSGYFVGQLLKETMLNLGPIFIKVGQSLSARSDIFGAEICEVLTELVDRIPPFPRSVAMKIIEEELGCSIEAAFSSISEEPVAAASFGQVYRGCTLDGHTVAVKVQRPDLHHAVLRDIYILRLGLGILRKVAKRKSNISLYADELGKGFYGELDYTIEAANATEFLEAHMKFPFMYIPKVLKHLSRRRVLTMEWLDGESGYELLLRSRGSGSYGVEYSESEQLEARRSLLDMVNKGVEATLVQLLETGILHADPHTGNMRYLSAGQIGFLDFGLLCRMEKKHQFAILASILHIVNGDWASLVYDLTEMDVVRPETNLHRLTLELENALGEVTFNDGIPDIKFSRVLGKIFSVALKHQFRMPPYYTLLLRSLASFEGLALATDPNFKTFQAAYPYVVQKLLRDNSAATRRILHSVVFNKQKEFQWHKLVLFLKAGATRKAVKALVCVDINSSMHTSTGENGVFEVTNSVLRLLLSKDGVVLRRLLMTADPASFIKAMLSKGALSYRKYARRALADLLYEWMIQATAGNDTSSPYSSDATTLSMSERGVVAPSAESSALLYGVLFRDRRMKVIFSRMLHALRKKPLLMLRFCCTSFVILISAVALSCHRFVVSWAEMYIVSRSVFPWRFALSV